MMTTTQLMHFRGVAARALVLQADPGDWVNYLSAREKLFDSLARHIVPEMTTEIELLHSKLAAAEVVLQTIVGQRGMTMLGPQGATFEADWGHQLGATRAYYDTANMAFEGLIKIKEIT